MKNSRTLSGKYRELILYGIFGAATTIVNWAVYSAAVKYLGIAMNIANLTAWIVAVFFAYVTNRSFVFQSSKGRAAQICREFVLFIGARIFSGIIEIAGLPLLYGLGMRQSILGVKGMAAKILVSIVVILLNYLFSKFVIFKSGQRERKNESEESL